MKIKNLQIGKKYFVDFNEKANPGLSSECYYTGPGLVTDINPDGYEPNTIEVLGDDGETGYYGPEDIIHEIKAKHVWIVEFFSSGEWNPWNRTHYATRQYARDYKDVYKNEYPETKFRVAKYICEK